METNVSAGLPAAPGNSPAPGELKSGEGDTTKRMSEMTHEGRRFVLNSPVLTNYGSYQFYKISLEEARAWARRGPFVSAVGHKSTAALLSELLGVEVPCSRTRIEMNVHDEALVVRLTVRLPEGKVLGREELRGLLESGAVEFGILKSVCRDCFSV